MTSIGNSAFRDCSGLTSIFIPESVTSIGNSAFAGCYFTNESFVNKSSLTSSDNWGVTLCDKETTDGMLIIGDAVIRCRPWVVSITIPSSVTSIVSLAFKNCSSLTSITIPNSVTTIGEWAFKNCSGLTSITIPNSVTSIGDSAFDGCSSLKSVHITDLAAWCNIKFSNTDSNPLYYAKRLFMDGNEITDLVIPNSVSSISGYAFCNCSGLTSITIPNSVTSIGNEAFKNCSGLTSVHIIDLAAWCKIEFSGYESNPLYYAKHLFMDGMEITDLAIPNGVESIGNYAFSRCESLTSLTIPNSVTSIGSYAFEDCSGLTSITIPEGVTSIEERVFSGCSGLKSLSIPNSVTWIKSYAFFNCSGLKDVYCYAESVPITYSNAFSYSPISSATLYVPEGSHEAYRATSPWSKFGTIVALTQDDIDGIHPIESLTPSLSKGEGDWYDLNGRKLDKPQKGINIIRYSDGTSKKVLVK